MTHHQFTEKDLPPLPDADVVEGFGYDYAIKTSKIIAWANVVLDWYQKKQLQANESDAVAAPPCVLTYDEDTDAWDSACGEKLFFDEGGPAENGMRFCYACGKKITVRAVLADEPLPQPDGPTQEQEQEAILQKLTDEAQAMGLYDAQPVQDEQAKISREWWKHQYDRAQASNVTHADTPPCAHIWEAKPSGQAPAASTEPYGWLYDWTHSSATGRPDEIHTSFTTDEGRARTGVGHTNVRAVCLATPVAAQAPAADGDALHATFEAVRKRFCKLPKYSFLLDGSGSVRRVRDKGGKWIEFDAAHELFDPVAVDAAVADMAAGREG